MATAYQSDSSITSRPLAIPAQCECAGEQLALAITALRCDGCEVQATGPWHGDCDFVRLVIDARITMNGQLQWRRGDRAGISFFGQLHPVVVNQLTR